MSRGRLPTKAATEGPVQLITGLVNGDNHVNPQILAILLDTVDSHAHCVAVGG